MILFFGVKGNKFKKVGNLIILGMVRCESLPISYDSTEEKNIFPALMNQCHIVFHFFLEAMPG